MRRSWRSGPGWPRRVSPRSSPCRGKCPWRRSRQFMPVFFRELCRDGQIDRAMAAARFVGAGSSGRGQPGVVPPPDQRPDLVRARIRAGPGPGIRPLARPAHLPHAQEGRNACRSSAPACSSATSARPASSLVAGPSATISRSPPTPGRTCRRSRSTSPSASGPAALRTMFEEELMRRPGAATRPRSDRVAHR